MSERPTFTETRYPSTRIPDGLVNFVNTSDGQPPVRFGEIGRWLLNNHLNTIRARRDYDRQSQAHPVVKGAEAVAVTALESIPFIGDGTTALEAIRGKTFDGLPLSVPERIIYGLLSIPPPFNPIDLPARPFVSIYHILDQHVFTPLLLDALGPEAQKEEQEAEQQSQVDIRAASTHGELISSVSASGIRRA